MFGIGGGYVDSFPFEILINYGIIGFITMAIFIVKLSRMVLRFNKNNRICLTANILWVVFLLNSLFEAYPPFGPGIKCSLLWMTIGFSIAEIEKAKKQICYYRF